MKIPSIFSWTAKIIVALIMLQTLYFKFSAAPESVYIFPKINIEPWGRYGIGVGELLASILLLITCYSWLGATLAIGLMSGALFFHLTILGIEVQEDGGYLFALALAVLLLSLFVLYSKRRCIPYLNKNLI